MALPSGNVIPLNPGSNHQSLLPDVCSQINLLASEHLSPSFNSLIPHLLKQFDVNQEIATNNQDIMRLMEVRNNLQKAADEIIGAFTNELTKIDLLNSAQESVESLSLLDNDDLTHKLSWISAAEKMRTEDNIQRLFRIKSRFENSFPDFNDQVPGSPEFICSCFSKVLIIISPDHDIEQQILTWFTQHIQPHADKLWIDIDQLLTDAGLEESKPNTPPPPSPEEKVPENNHSGDKYSSSATSSISTDSASSMFSGLQEGLDSELMDSLAERLVLRVEDMLVQDDIIPEAKLGRVRSIDLASVLNLLQHEITNQHLSIINLNESVKTALETHNGNNKLSRRHEDLINIVGLLFEYILDDHQLPDAVRKEIGLLQIPVLKLAIFDQSFLTDREHPARMLLNEMTSAGMQYQEERILNSSVLPLIEYTVRTIISESQENPDIFKYSLEHFMSELQTIQIIEDPIEEKQEDQEEFLIIDSLPDEAEEIEEAIEIEHQEPLSVELDEEAEDFDEEIILESNKTLTPLEDSEPEDDQSPIESELIEPPSEKLEENIIIPFIPFEGIRTGQWVEFVGEGDSHRMRCKLASIDYQSGRYCFENRSGLKVAEFTESQLTREIERGNLIVLEDHQIFDRALQAVIDKFKKR